MPASIWREIDLELVGVEAHRHVELEAGRHPRALGRNMLGDEGDDAGREIHGEAFGRLRDAIDRDQRCTRDRLGDGPRPGREGRAVGLLELERGRGAVADADLPDRAPTASAPGAQDL